MALPSPIHAWQDVDCDWGPASSESDMINSQNSSQPLVNAPGNGISSPPDSHASLHQPQSFVPPRLRERSLALIGGWVYALGGTMDSDHDERHRRGGVDRARTLNLTCSACSF